MQLKAYYGMKNAYILLKKYILKKLIILRSSKTFLVRGALLEPKFAQGALTQVVSQKLSITSH